MKRKRVGRPWTSPDGRKKTTLGMRVTAALKRKMINAAAASGRSLSAEIDLRLERSFRDEWVIDEIRKMWEART